jgi:hypothetical protein
MGRFWFIVVFSVGPSGEGSISFHGGLRLCMGWEGLGMDLEPGLEFGFARSGERAGLELEMGLGRGLVGGGLELGFLSMTHPMFCRYCLTIRFFLFEFSEHFVFAFSQSCRTGGPTSEINQALLACPQPPFQLRICPCIKHAGINSFDCLFFQAATAQGAFEYSANPCPTAPLSNFPIPRNLRIRKFCKPSPTSHGG